MKTLLVSLCLVLYGCGMYTPKIDGHLNETKTVSVGSPMLSWSDRHLGGGRSGSLVYTGKTSDTIRISADASVWTTGRYGRSASAPNIRELTYPATFPQEITYQSIKLRVENADANTITFTPMAFPEGYEQQ